ncbi:MAG: lamin tail domain-containing protein [Candidatus Heimdallarchaeum aukensis]|uniref:Lamin tail domain-containing protein n=1 Tax=Candidatus Heimdallarchaeum aukensis TaxID=2876573 RepID=A0A9Y1FKW7_9ARCH|nr:MAG: lamin tail domain-containing protein [Candidatus Heimdallarchaeum aukensis]
MRIKVRNILLIFLIVVGSIYVSNIANSNIEGTNIIITEVLYDAPNSDSTEEWIELYNPTDQIISIDNWIIEDNYDSFTLTGTLDAYGYFVIAKQSSAFNSLYGFNPDLDGMTLALSNSGDQVRLSDNTGAEVDFVAWENYVSGWSVSAVDATIRRITATDTDSGSDWENSGSLGDPGTGSYSSGGEDTTPPTVTITSPIDGATVYGTVQITVDATDANGISSYEIYIDNVLRATSSSYSWDTTVEEDGSHTIVAKAQDPSGNWGEDTITVNVDNTNPPPSPPSDYAKIMTYNIEQSGLDPDWKQVVKEENPDIVIFVETGTWDDNNNELLNQYVNEFNSYFVDEAPYVGYTAQDITYSTSGEAIMSRYPIIENTQIPIVSLDDGSSYDVTHDFMSWKVNISGTPVYIIGAHLKASSGSDNEWRREREQEGIINYMDSLGEVPIIYMGDLNSFSPEDTGDLAPLGDLGYGPMTMTIWPDDPTYGQYSSQNHLFTDVFRTLNPTEPGYTYGHQDPQYKSRIDYIVVNDHLDDFLINSTVGDTPTADTGSDHYCVDMFIDVAALNNGAPPDTTPPAKVTDLTATPISSSQIDLSWTANTEGDLSYYKIYRDGVFIAQTTTTDYSDTGLEPSTTYTYEVSAVDTSNNEGVKSDPVSATTDSVTTETIHVDSIVTGLYVGRKDPVFTETNSFQPKDIVIIRVKIVDSNGIAVEGVSVTITITDSEGDVVTLTSTTDSQGIAEFSYRLSPRAPLGTYTINVTDVSLSGYTYDPTANVVSSVDFTVS